MISLLLRTSSITLRESRKGAESDDEYDYYRSAENQVT